MAAAVKNSWTERRAEAKNSDAAETRTSWRDVVRAEPEETN